MFNAASVEAARSADDPMHDVSLFPAPRVQREVNHGGVRVGLQEELGEVRAILTGDTSDQGNLAKARMRIY